MIASEEKPTTLIDQSSKPADKILDELLEGVEDRKARMKRIRKEERQRGMSEQDIWEEDNEKKINALKFEMDMNMRRLRSNCYDVDSVTERWDLTNVEYYIDHIQREVDAARKVLEKMVDFQETKKEKKIKLLKE